MTIDMIKTESAAIELTATLWKIKAETGKRKHKILEEFGFYVDELQFNCPCCDYVFHETDISPGYDDNRCRCKKVCPLRDLWPAGCLSKKSPYARFESEYDHNYKPFASKKEEHRAALKIAKFAGELAGTWWEL